MSDVFISYKAEDRPRVRPIVDALIADGLSVWWDAHIGAGEEWRDAIADHLEKAKCVIVVWSKRSAGPDGRFVRDEATRALKRHAYVPVTIDKIDPPLGFGETQCLPLSGWKGNRDDPRYLALLDSARQLVGGSRDIPARAAAERPAGSGLDRRAVLAGGAVAGLAATGGLGWYLLNGSSAQASSVAVMPFANLSGDPAQAYFSDGLAEELRTALSRIGGLKVIGRTSSEAVKDQDSTTAARKLDVSNILTGSVRRSPSMIRVSAQLVDGGDGSEKWSQSFDRADGDALQIQSDIAEAVVGQLRSRLGGAGKAAIALGGTSNSQAQDLVLKGDANLDGSREGFAARAALYDAAIALDPNYALALARKAQMTTSIASYYGKSIDELNRALADAQITARRAIAIAPDLADGHYALGENRSNALDFQTGWAEYQRALACPGCPPQLKLVIAKWVAQIGGFGRANRLLEDVAASDPLNPDVLLNRATILLMQRRNEESIALGEEYLRGQPSSTLGRAYLSTALLQAGRNAEAVVVADKLPHEHPMYFVVRSFAAAQTGDRAKAAAIREDMRRLVGDNGAFQYAEMSVAVGDRDAAIRELENAVRFRDPGLAFIKTDFAFDAMRDDPRLQAIVARLNFPAVS